ncbi:MAG: DUF2806 domain-containing protein [Alphaproteobacteria bacterium]|nr:DUF2806 domain-containing protein [Alphaproteobacteria bacterium]
MNWIAKLSEGSQRVINTVKAIGPFAISQSDKMSEAWQRHQGRLAQVDMLKELLSNEIETRGTIKKLLLERYVAAPDDERIRIERDLEFVDGITRQVQITLKSLSYGDEKSAETTPPTSAPIEDHWIDKFNELARKRNEEWRADLLARALACETATPSSVSPRALWLIGNMEEGLFKAFSDLLNLCIWIGGSPILPHSHVEAFDRVVPNTNRTVGNLIFQLGDIGVIADHLTSFRQYSPGSAFIASYEETRYVIIPKQKIEVRGILLTLLGDSVAKFCNPNWNSSGLSVFNDWIKTISPEMAELKLLTGQVAT